MAKPKPSAYGIAKVVWKNELLFHVLTWKMLERVG